MNDKTISLLIKIILTFITVGVITILIIKRFIYFRPSNYCFPMKESYKIIQHGHINSAFLEGTSDKIILYCHGNAGNISYCDKKMTDLNDIGYSVMIFDYSGYGKSSGVPSEQQMYDDASTMISLIRKTHTQDQIILYGFSMGATVASYVARRYGIPTLILEAPLCGMKSFVETKFPSLSFLKFIFPEFDIKSLLDGRKERTLLMYSYDDEILSHKSIMQIERYVTKTIRIKGTHTLLQVPLDEVKKFIEN